jgi:hypothetical protein
MVLIPAVRSCIVQAPDNEGSYQLRVIGDFEGDLVVSVTNLFLFVTDHMAKKLEHWSLTSLT